MDSNKAEDIFVANSIYPDADMVFSFRLSSIEEIMGHCLIVLDTNVLLAPYSLGKEDLLEQCKKTYSQLTNVGRLFIPGQVAREFAKNRPVKIGELYQQLTRKKQVQQISTSKYPLLKSIEGYSNILAMEADINQRMKEYQQALKIILSHIQTWQWNDPVSLLYREVFPKHSVIDIPFNEEEVRKELNRRYSHSIPPGYKDAGKPDSGIGDFLIWKTILELGKMHQKDVIFVSGDEKADWYVKSEGQSLCLRYELIDEFRRASLGHAFHAIKFSRFLELFGASEQVVEDVRQEENSLVVKGRTISPIEPEIQTNAIKLNAICDRLKEVLNSEAIEIVKMEIFQEYAEFLIYSPKFATGEVNLRIYVRDISSLDVHEFIDKPGVGKVIATTEVIKPSAHAAADKFSFFLLIPNVDLDSILSRDVSLTFLFR